MCFVATPCFPDEASRIVKSKEFFRLAKIDETVKRAQDNILTQMKAGMARQLASSRLTPEQQKSATQFQEKLSAYVITSLSWTKLEPAYAKVYSDAYTDKELDDMIAFYKSPSGQAMVAKNPEISTKSNEIMKAKMAEMAPVIQKMARDYMAQATGTPKPAQK